MLGYSLYALSGAYALVLFSTLPPTALVVAMLLIAAVATAQQHSRPVAVALLGFVWMWYAASAQLADKLHPGEQGKSITVAAKIIDFPQVNATSIRMLVAPVSTGGLADRIRPVGTPVSADGMPHRIRLVGTPVSADGLPDRIRLTWFRPLQQPALGEVWQLRVRLKRPRGFANPAGFDFEGWLHRQGIGATGYVVEHASNARLHETRQRSRASVRRRIVERIDALLPVGDARAVLKAVTVGARGEISDRQWQLYARTGTSHLMAISGLHIGLAAAGVFLFVWVLIAPFCRRCNVRDIALTAAVMAAFCYAELSGFAVPAKRAFLMALLIALAIALRRRITSGHVLGSVCLFVAGADPLSLYAPGFMLSFCAVAILIWAAQSFEPIESNSRFWHLSRIRARVQQLARIQIVLLFGLLPLTLAIFGRVAWLAPLVNMAVLPLFNLVIVPAGLLGLLLDGHASYAGDLLLTLSFTGIRIVLGFLRVIGEWPISNFEPSLNGNIVFLIAGATAVRAIAPAGWPGRQLALVAIVATLSYRPPLPRPGCLDFQILDVGQGLAVVLRTASRTLVYDTGPSFRSGSSTAKLVIAPFLKARGIHVIDTLILSHADLDHAGGANWLKNAVDVKRILSGEPAESGGQPCHLGQDWLWDGVRFRILHPAQRGQWEGNNASCVLTVQVGEHKLLISGDIEAPAERRMVAGRVLHPVNLVVVPHHGSRTSSSAEFVRSLRPEIAIVAAGHQNRWGFPKPDVVARWESAGARVLTTAQAGGIGGQYCAGSEAGALTLDRRQSRRYWHDKEI